MNVTIDNLEIRSVELPPIVNLISSLLVLVMAVYIVASICQLVANCKTPEAQHVDYEPSAPLMADTTL